MDKQLMDCFSHPVKCKLFLEVLSAGTVTAKQLIETYHDISQTTLYRYLKQMTDDNILNVIEETPIRGTVEKTYALGIDFNDSVQDILENNSGDAYLMLFMQYISGFIKTFQSYCSKPDINIREDISAFTLAPVYATNDELVHAMTEIGTILSGLLQNKPSPDRKLRTFGFIVTPPEKQEQ